MNYAEKNNRGSALLVAMIAMGVLTAMLASSMQRATVDTTLAGQTNKKARSKGIAQAGLNLTARKVLDEYISNDSFDALLDTIEFNTSSGGQYSVMIMDNDDIGGVDQDGDGSSTTDSDQIVRLVATGAVGLSEQVIEAFYKIAPGTSTEAPDSSGIGAVGLCADNADITRASNISGSDLTPPNYPCSGANCNGVSSGSPTATGLSYNSGSTVDLDGGTPGGSPGVNSNAGIDCPEWETFSSTAASSAQTTLAASDGPFNASGMAAEFGTPTDPRVMVIEGPGSAQFNGNLYGNGILIIRNAHVTFNGTFTYAGLIIIEDEGGGIYLKGTATIFGSMMVINANNEDSQVEIGIKSAGTQINYSAEGLGRASTALDNAGGGSSSSLSLVAWRATEPWQSD